MAQKKVMLTTSDHIIFEVEESVVLEWKTFEDMMEDIEIEEAVPLPNLSSTVLDRVIQYSLYHLECQKSLDENSEYSLEDIKNWDAEFVKVDYATLAALINAANYLHIPSLLHLTCQAVADMIHGKKPEQIRKICNKRDRSTQTDPLQDTREQIRKICNRKDNFTQEEEETTKKN